MLLLDLGRVSWSWIYRLGFLRFSEDVNMHD